MLWAICGHGVCSCGDQSPQHHRAAQQLDRFADVGKAVPQHGSRTAEMGLYDGRDLQDGTSQEGEGDLRNDWELEPADPGLETKGEVPIYSQEGPECDASGEKV